MNSLIECSHVAFGYENREVVSDVTIAVEAGDYICIVGENGSGKSTLMKGILGLVKPTKGSIVIADELKKNGIGYLPQQTDAQKDFPATVYEVVQSGHLRHKGRRPYYSREEKQKAYSNMEKMGIEMLSKHCYRELSGGQQQRVLIARALCATNSLLLLDEPATGLDPAAIQDFYKTIENLNQKEGIAILMVTHDIHNSIRQAGKILHLRQTVVFYGSADAYRDSLAGHEFLGGEMGWKQ